MDIILGVGTLLIVLLAMTLFLNFAPYGKKGLQALSVLPVQHSYHKHFKLCHWWRL